MRKDLGRAGQRVVNRAGTEKLLDEKFPEFLACKRRAGATKFVRTRVYRWETLARAGNFDLTVC